jgi:hypothetical protein
MICSVCKKNKAEVHAKKSKLMPDMKLLLCNDCLEEKREPRFAIVIYGRENGFEPIRKYIKDHRYVGDPITARELVK